MKKVKTSFNGETITFEALDNEDVAALLLKVIKQMKGFRPDIIIGIARGGIPISHEISEVLGVHCEVIRFQRYMGRMKFAQTLHIIKEPKTAMKGKNVLVVDDVSDKGDSLKAAEKYLASKGVKKKDIKCLTLHAKPWTKKQPDFVASKTTNWLIYPWDLKEHKEDLLGKIPRAAYEKLFSKE